MKAFHPKVVFLKAMLPQTESTSLYSFTQIK